MARAVTELAPLNSTVQHLEMSSIYWPAYKNTHGVPRTELLGGDL